MRAVPVPAAPEGDRAAPAEWTRARRADALLVTLGAALLALTAARLPAAWESGNALNHVSGAWMGLADDLSRGTFYRPLQAPDLGFGGTRFFPLAFALHGALLRLGAPLLASGYALSLAAGVLLLAAAFLLLRRLGLRAPLAAAFAALALAGFAGQHALAAVRGDLLAVALQALGLAVVARAMGAGVAGPSRRALLLAAAAFTLAFAAKPTSLTAPAAAAAALALGGRARGALALALATSGGALGVTLATDALSGGRFLSVMAACAAGGAGTGDLIRAPVRLARTFLLGDRAGLLLVAAGVAAALAAAPRARAGWRAPGASALLLAVLWLGAALGGLLLVMSSPGTGVNHLLEVEVAAAVALGVCSASAGDAARVARRLAPAAALGGLVLSGVLWREDTRTSRLAELRAVIAAAPAGPILSEDPLVPLLAGARPLLLDPWMLRLAAARDPELARPLLEALHARALPAVVLFQDLSDPSADGWYAHGNLGPAPVAEIRARYRLATRAGRYHLYLPAPREDAGQGAPVLVVGPTPAATAGPGDRAGAGAPGWRAGAATSSARDGAAPPAGSPRAERPRPDAGRPAPPGL